MPLWHGYWPPFSVSLSTPPLLNLILRPYWPSSLYLIYVPCFIQLETLIQYFVFLGCLSSSYLHILILPILKRPAPKKLSRTPPSRLLSYPQTYVPSRAMPAFWPRRASTIVRLSLDFFVFLLSLLSFALKNLEGRGHLLVIFVICHDTLHSLYSVRMS